ncbi:hypothetical protein I302_105004 [Kwoniella bestiolae CBS 10118]|uniref:Impact N-terminal domain-containing protein n=1 Tax=Kwoniella bestiolae CBS 10118 TaxID=1296100 RepID=A0A1B9FR77_9TREE|nr:hypothetical protein I302_08924 [Kwoniella bestiolae CBS 10118]OCF21252.1 hypothetical protein I302_08924 [Kwoniella bestiolae CBS 10118]
MTSTKRPSSPSPTPIDPPAAPPTKKPRSSPPPASTKSMSLHSWLHPTFPPPLQSHSPPLHSSSSTFLSFTLSHLPPSHITSLPSLEKECRRIVRELNVVALVGDLVSKNDEGAFQDGEGRVQGRGKERVREPDHRMWAVRTLALREGRDGTGGEGDYQLLEASFDDNEKYGGQTILKALRENNGIDVLTVCCRWYGGDMIGPIRFQHITTTVLTSLKSTLKLMTLRDLRTSLGTLDEEIASLRSGLAPSQGEQNPAQNGDSGKGKYDEIEDEKKLERLVVARERTKDALEKKLGKPT